jgi:hypothetical protein
LKQRAAKIPGAVRKLRLTEALERLVQLYDALGQKQKAQQWRVKLQAERTSSKGQEAHADKPQAPSRKGGN